MDSLCQTLLQTHSAGGGSFQPCHTSCICSGDSLPYITGALMQAFDASSVINCDRCCVNLYVTFAVTARQGGTCALLSRLHLWLIDCCDVQLPLQQIAWRLSEEPCRLIICGKGTAGSIAQHAAMAIHEMLRESSADQARYSAPGNCCPLTRSCSAFTSQLLYA